MAFSSTSFPLTKSSITCPPPYSNGCVSLMLVAPMYRSTAAPGWQIGTLFIQALSILIGGSECPVLMIAPELHIAPNVPVVTTSTSLKATSMPLFSTRRFISSAVMT